MNREKKKKEKKEKKKKQRKQKRKKTLREKPANRSKQFVKPHTIAISPICSFFSEFFREKKPPNF
jgi:hypothetical protein